MKKPVHGDVEDADIIIRLFRRMANHKDCWRRCKSPACRRRQRCMGNPVECVTEGKPRPEITEAERALAMHDLRMQLKERIALVHAQAEESERLKVAGGVQTKWPKPQARKSVANGPSAKSRAAKRRAAKPAADASPR